MEGLRSSVGFKTPIDTWADVANALGVSVPSAMEFLKGWRPKAAQALDDVDAQLTALDEVSTVGGEIVDTETVGLDSLQRFRERTATPRDHRRLVRIQIDPALLEQAFYLADILRLGGGAQRGEFL